MIITESDSSQEPPGPSCLHVAAHSTEKEDSSMKDEEFSFSCPLDELLSMFTGKLSPKQVIGVFRCLLKGPTSDSILKMTRNLYDILSATKVRYHEARCAWSDMVTYYKHP